MARSRRLGHHSAFLMIWREVVVTALADDARAAGIASGNCSLIASAMRTLLLGLIVGLALRLTRNRNPHIEKAAWIVVLIASLAMPIMLAALPHALPKAVSLDLPSRSSTVNTLLTTAIDAASNTPLSEPKTQANAIGWREMACFLYACVSGILLLRIAIGLLNAVSIST